MLLRVDFGVPTLDVVHFLCSYVLNATDRAPDLNCKFRVETRVKQSVIAMDVKSGRGVLCIEFSDLTSLPRF